MADLLNLDTFDFGTENTNTPGDQEGLTYQLLGSQMNKKAPSTDLYDFNLPEAKYKTPFSYNIKDYERYMASDAFPKVGIDPLLSQEELERVYDKNQSNTEAFTNVMGKLWDKTANSFTDFFRADYMTNDQLINHAYKELEKEKLNDIFNPNFDSRSKETRESFLQWIPGFEGSGDNYEQFIPNLGYTVGMMTAGVAQTLITGRILTGLGALTEVGETVYKGKKMWDILSGFDNMKIAVNAAKTFNQGNSLVKGLQIGVEGLNMFAAYRGEAGVEAASTGQATFEHLQDQFYRTHGYMPFQEDIDRMKNTAYKAAKLDFDINAPILLTSNFIQFSRALMPAGARVLSEFEKDALKGYTLTGKIGAATLAEETFSDLWKNAGTLGRFKLATDLVGKSLSVVKNPLAEGAEESLQRFGSTFAEDYFVDEYNMGKGDIWKSTKYSTQDMLSKQGLQEFIGGALTGLGTHLVGKFGEVTGISDRIAKAINEPTKAEREMQKTSYRASVLDLVNNSSIDFALKDKGLVNAVREHLLTKDLIKFNNQNNLFEAANTHYAGIYNMVWNAVKSGQTDYIIKQFEKFGDATDLESVAKKLNIDPSTINKENLRELTNSIIDKIKSTRDIYQGVIGEFSKTNVEKNLINQHNVLLKEALAYQADLYKKYDIPVDAEDLTNYATRWTPEERSKHDEYNNALENKKIELYAYQEALKVAAVSYSTLRDAKNRIDSIVKGINSNKDGLIYNESLKLLGPNSLRELRKSVKLYIDNATDSSDIKKLTKQLEIIDSASEALKKGDVEQLGKLMQEYAEVSRYEGYNSDLSLQLNKKTLDSLIDIAKLEKQYRANLDIFNYLSSADNFETYKNYSYERLQDFFKNVKEWNQTMMDDFMNKLNTPNEEKTPSTVDVSSEVPGTENPVSVEVDKKLDNEPSTEIPENHEALDSREMKEKIKSIQGANSPYIVKIYKDENGKHYITVKYSSDLYGTGEVNASEKEKVQSKFAKLIQELDAEEQTKIKKKETTNKINEIVDRYKSRIDALVNPKKEDVNKIQEELDRETIKMDLSEDDSKKLKELNALIQGVRTYDDTDFDAQQDNTFIPETLRSNTQKSASASQTSYKSSLKTTSSDVDMATGQLKDNPYSVFRRNFLKVLPKIKNLFANKDNSNNSLYRFIVTKDTKELQQKVHGQEYNKSAIILMQIKNGDKWETAFVNPDTFEITMTDQPGYLPVVLSFNLPGSAKSSFNYDEAAKILSSKERDKYPTKEAALDFFRKEDAVNNALRKAAIESDNKDDADNNNPRIIGIVDINQGIVYNPTQLNEASVVLSGLDQKNITIATQNILGGRFVPIGSVHVKIGDNRYVELIQKNIPKNVVDRIDALMNHTYPSEIVEGMPIVVQNVVKYMSSFVYTRKGILTFEYNPKSQKIQLQATRPNELPEYFNSLTEYEDKYGKVRLNVSQYILNQENYTSFSINNGKLVESSLNVESYIDFVIKNSAVKGDYTQADKDSPEPLYVSAYFTFETLFQPEVIENTTSSTAAATEPVETLESVKDELSKKSNTLVNNNKIFKTNDGKFNVSIKQNSKTKVTFKFDTIEKAYEFAKNVNNYTTYEQKENYAQQVKNGLVTPTQTQTSILSEKETREKIKTAFLTSGFKGATADGSDFRSIVGRDAIENVDENKIVRYTKDGKNYVGALLHFKREGDGTPSFMVGITDNERNGAVFISVEDTGNLPNNIESLLIDEGIKQLQNNRITSEVTENSFHNLDQLKAQYDVLQGATPIVERKVIQKTTQQEEAEKKLEKLNEKKLQLTSDEKEYVNPNDQNDRYKRVSSLKGEFIGRVNDASERGTIIDGLLRDFISRKISTLDELKKAYLNDKLAQKISTFNDNFLSDIYKVFVDFEKYFNDRNIVLLTNVNTLWGEINGEKYAGTVDLLGIKPDGTVIIIDLKTSSQNRRKQYEIVSKLKEIAGDDYEVIKKAIKENNNDVVEAFATINTLDEEKVDRIFQELIELFPEEVNDGKFNIYFYKDDDSIQQSAYAEILRQRTELEADGVFAFPVQTTKNSKKEYSSATPNLSKENEFTLVVPIDRKLFPEVPGTPTSDKDYNDDTDRVLPEDPFRVIVGERVAEASNEELEELQTIAGRAGIDVLFKAINSKYYGQFTTSGVIIYGSLTNGTGYHEAWHVFTQMFLTKEEKLKLYKEVRNKIPRLAYASPIRIEEFLAEQYREWRQTGKCEALEKSPTKKSIFKRILAFVDKVFGGKFNLERAYSDLKVDQDILKQYFEEAKALSSDKTVSFGYTPSKTNAFWGKLNSVKGLEDMTVSQLLPYSRHTDCLFSEIISTPLTSGKYKGQVIGEKYTIVSAFENPVIVEVLTNELKERLSTLAANSTDQQTADDLNYIIDNFRDFLKFNENYSKNSYKLLSEEEDEIDQVEDETSGKNEVYNKRNDEQNTFLSAKYVTKKMLMHVPKCIWKNGTWEIVKDEKGLMIPSDPNALWTLIALELNGELIEEKMFAKIYSKETQRKIPELGYISERMLPTFDSKLNQFSMKAGFYQSFNRVYVPIYTTVQKVKMLTKNGESIIAYEWFQNEETKNNQRAIESRAFTRFQTFSEDSDLGSLDIIKKKDGKNILGPGFLELFNAGDKFTMINDSNKMFLLHLMGLKIPNIEGANMMSEFKALELPLQQIANTLRDRVQGSPEAIYDIIQELKVGRNVFNGEIIEFSPNEKKSIGQVINFISKYTLEDPSASMRGSSGTIRYAIQLNNKFSVDNYWLSKTGSYEEILNAKDYNYDYERMNVDKFANARGSLWLRMMFGKTVNDTNTKHNRVVDTLNNPVTILLDSYSGYNYENEQGEKSIQKDSDKLNPREKFLVDFATFLKTGKINTNQNASKKTYISLRLSNYSPRGANVSSHYITFENLRSSSSGFDLASFKEVWKNYLEAELFKISNPNYIKVGDNSFIYFDFLEKEENKDLANKLKAEANKLATEQRDGNGKVNLMEVVENNIEDLSRVMLTYFNNAKNDVRDIFNKLEINERELPYDIMEENTFDNVLKMFVMNLYITKMEEMKLFRASPFNYTDPFKRFGQDVSTGNYPMVNESFVNLIENSEEYAFSNGVRTSPTPRDSYKKANFVIMEDQKNTVLPILNNNSAEVDITGRAVPVSKIVADAAYSYNLLLRGHLGYTPGYTNQLISKLKKQFEKPYSKTNITDGGGYCTLDFYKRFMISVDNWSPAKESLYRALSIKYKLDNGLVYKTEEEKNKARIEMKNLFEAGEGAVFNIAKIQVNVDTIINGVEAKVLHKFSLAPLIPDQIATKDLEDIHTQMLREGIDYFPFQSSSKTSEAIFKDSINKIFDESGSFSNGINKDLGISIQLTGMKEQIITASEEKQGKRLGVQLVQLAFTNLISRGKPIDFKGTKEEFRKAKYEDLSPIGKAYRDFIESMKKIRLENKLKIMDELGIEETSKNKFAIRDAKKLVEKLQKLAVERQASVNIKKYVAYDPNTKQFLNPLDFALNVDEIKKLIYGLIDRRLRKMETYGSMSIQMSDFGQREKNHNFRNATELEKLEYGANGLPFYYLKKDKNGNVVSSKAGCKIAMTGDYKNLLNLKEVKKYAKEKNVDPVIAINALLRTKEFREKYEDALTIVGYRIPTQGPNSMDVFVIHEFLPEYMGNTIILPAGITTKSGADYDIDKMSLFFKHLDLNGNVIRNMSEEEKQDIISQIAKLKNDLDQDREALELAKDYKKQNKKNIIELKEAINNNKKYIDQLVEDPDFDEDELLDTEEQMKNDKKLLKDYYKAIGKDSTDVIEKYYDNVRKLKNLRKSINTRSIYQNQLVDALERTFTLSEMFYSLVRPNNNDVLEPLAEKIAIKLNRLQKKENYTNSNLLTYDASYNKHIQLQEGKGSLGGYATYNKLIINGAAADLTLSPDFRITKDKDGNPKFIKSTNPLLTDAQKKVMIDKDGKLLAGSAVSLNKDGEVMFVQDNISEGVNITVDVENKPILTDLGLNSYNSWVSLYLTGLKHVDPNILWTFLNQPILIQLYKAFDASGTYKEKQILADMVNKNFKDEFIKAEITPKNVINYLIGVGSKVDSFDFQDLNNFLKELPYSKLNTLELGPVFRETQFKVLAYYLLANEEAKILQRLRKNTSFDSKKFNTLFEIPRMQKEKEKLLNDQILIDNPEEFYEHSVSMLYDEMEIISAINTTLFPIGSNEIVANMFTMEEDSDEDGEDVTNDLVPNRNVKTDLQKMKAEKVLLNDVIFGIVQNFGDPFGKIYNNDEIPDGSLVSSNKKNSMYMTIDKTDKGYNVVNTSTGQKEFIPFEEITQFESYKLADFAEPMLIKSKNSQTLSMFERIAEIKNNHPELATRFPVINRLLLNKKILNRNESIESIELFRNDANETPDKDSYTEQFMDLVNHPDPDISSTFKDLMTVAFYQSGYNMSPLYFTDVLYYEETILPMIKNSNNRFLEILRKDPFLMIRFLDNLGELIKFNNPKFYRYLKSDRSRVNRNYSRGRNYAIDLNNLTQDYIALSTPEQKEEVSTKPSTTAAKVKKIISGGQTGVDRIGLEVGKEAGLQTGGTATPGYVIEGNKKDLSLKDFGVEEISTELQAGKSGKEFYLPRTEQNVLNSDGTVYFATDEDSAGKIATERFAKQYNKPFLLNPTVEELRNWLSLNNIETLNVAGNRGSKLSKEKAQEIKNILKEAISKSTTQINEKSAKVEKRAITKDKNQLSLFEDNLSNTNDGEVGTDTYVEPSDESSAENTGDKKSSNNDLDPNDITNENTKC